MTLAFQQSTNKMHCKVETVDLFLEDSFNLGGASLSSGRVKMDNTIFVNSRKIELVTLKNICC